MRIEKITSMNISLVVKLLTEKNGFIKKLKSVSTLDLILRVQKENTEDFQRLHKNIMTTL